MEWTEEQLLMVGGVVMVVVSCEYQLEVAVVVVVSQ